MTLQVLHGLDIDKTAITHDLAACRTLVPTVFKHQPATINQPVFNCLANGLDGIKTIGPWCQGHAWFKTQVTPYKVWVACIDIGWITGDQVEFAL